MANQEAKFIERVEIKGLWNRYDVDWQLNPDVNILVGENGTGKSTIFNIALQAIEKCADKLKKDNLINFKQEDWIDNAKISFKPTSIIPFNSKSNGIQKDSNDILIPKIYHIQTFDAHLNVSDLDKNFNKNLYTQLDFNLNEKIDEFVNYQLDQTKKIINQKIEATLVFAKIRYFIDTLNRLFANTDKVVDENENRIVFTLDRKDKIEANQLSSGEKQLLIILLTVLCQDEKPSVLLLDEPEISLHVSWQYELIKIIRTLNPNCQLIIVTHSTSIFTKGWMDKIFFMTGKEGILHPIAEKV